MELSDEVFYMDIVKTNEKMNAVGVTREPATIFAFHNGDRPEKNVCSSKRIHRKNVLPLHWV